MDLALHFPCVSLIKQRLRSTKSMSEIVDFPLLSFGESLSRRAFNGDRRMWLSSSSRGRPRKGYVCCKKPADEPSSNPSKRKQEEIISLFRRIQSSISEENESQGDEEKKNRDGSYDDKTLSKAILDVLEKSKNKAEGDTGVKETPKRQAKVARPPSSFAKRSPVRPLSGSRGKPPVSKSDKAIEETTEKEEKAPLIETMKLAELKEVAKKKGLKGYSKLKKSELLDMLRSF